MSGGAPAPAFMGWLFIARLALVQASLGAIIVLTTSTLNRVMVVELALAAMIPGALVTVREGLQFLRPRWGHGSDVGGRRTPWIVGGMALLALGGIGAGLSTARMGTDMTTGLIGAVVSYIVIGIGVGAAGTNLLALLAKRVAPARRAAAATIVWLMMFVGFIISAAVAGAFLDIADSVADGGSGYSPDRLVVVTTGVCIVAFLVSALAMWGVEGRRAPAPAPEAPPATTAPAPKPRFLEALAEIWHEDESRRLAIFIFVSMLAYNIQDLILEPFAGAVFSYTVGASTQLTSVQHSGALAGMLLVGILASGFGGGRPAVLKLWTMGGCVASGLSLLAIAVSGHFPEVWPLRVTVFLMGVANGAFAVAAISTMMGLAGAGAPDREGIRMGVWGAAQAIAFALGGFLGTVAVDATRALMDTPANAYGVVFAAEGLLFASSALLAARVGGVAALSRLRGGSGEATADQSMPAQ
ncbi:BCD family MFS transporter [Rhodospira trueperi]|uniref:MFS transporter, BCD family, chlorophyll transporter n=1 Tax=Rhodospira trueperi TaxID=69960 RepID=A0A1G6ZXL6_9PROT|nr:BCD family MFS transporter [Rhodospira trueperi]SDE07221.1 MFS transporter, BCD family, chlorophyll transporter [Rhodospira trueperi]